MLLVLLAAFTLTACNPGPKEPVPEPTPEEKPFVSKLPERTGESPHLNGIYKNTKNGMDTYIFLMNYYDDWANVQGYMIQSVGNNLTSLKAIVSGPEYAWDRIAGNGQTGGRVYRIAGTYDMTIEDNKIKEERNPKLLPDFQGWFGMVQDPEYEGTYIITDELYIEWDKPENVPNGCYVNGNFVEYKIMEGEKIRGVPSSGKSVVNVPDITSLAFYGTWKEVKVADLPFKLPENFHKYSRYHPLYD